MILKKIKNTYITKNEFIKKSCRSGVSVRGNSDNENKKIANESYLKKNKKFFIRI